ncbi:MAG: BREX-2 system phosphatase PglZ [Deltaproteobacteria bacterium]|nr:MAG: BREX-2 system phosphatase PglZ [Deltaproteobacteria bacterium]
MSSRTLITLLIGRDRALERTGLMLVHDAGAFESLPETMTANGLTIRLRRTESELELRHALWDAGSTPLIARLPESLAMNMPADLLRASARQRVHTLSQDEILGTLLGTRVIGIDETYLYKLGVRYLDQVRGALDRKTTPTVLDSDMLQRTLVEILDELADLRAAQPAHTLARWTEKAPAWDDDIVKLARSVLTSDRSVSGRILAWALDAPAERPRQIVTYGAILAIDEALPDQTWGPLLPLREGKAHDDPDVKELRRTLGWLASGAITDLGPMALPLLREADVAARRVLTPAQHRSSTLLPLAFRDLAHAIAHRLEHGETLPDSALHPLRAHAFAQTAHAEIDQLTDLARLSRYLGRALDPAADVGELATSYLSDGAHAERLIQQIQRRVGVVVEHQAATEAVIERVRARRNQENHAFAMMLAADYASALHHEAVIPLHKFSQRALQPMWNGSKGARVYLVVLDGCSVPVFLDLLDQLHQGSEPIGLELRADNSPHLEPGFAPLPTITSHARGALFAGRIPGDPFANETTYRDVEERKTDPARFRRHAGLGGRTRQLFLKGDLADNGVALLNALRGDVEVIAAVFNAVDDAIGSKNTGQAWSVNATDIKAFLPSLKTALQNGRKVVVTADHGHTPFVGLDHRAGQGTAPRFARLEPGDPVPEGFIEIDCADLAGERGRFAFAWKTGVYLGMPQVGFHGGCGLEEVIVPVAWLRANDGVRPDLPAWYAYGVSPPLTATGDNRPKAAKAMMKETKELASTPTPARTGARTTPPQLTLIGSNPIETYAAKAEAAGVPAGVRDAFPDEALAVLVLLLEQDVARSAEIGRALGRAPHRVDGWLTKLNRQLQPHGVGLVSEKLPDGTQQWRYEGAKES